jgi:flagellar biosynthesis protein FlhF
MHPQTFIARDIPSAFAAARRALGEDVMMLRSETRREGGAWVAEVVAAPAAEVELFRRRLEAAPLPVTRGPRPFTVALVGPTGAGKTTTLAKLALHASAFGRRRVGVVTLDTYRAGAVEQLGTFTDIAGIPLEVVYHRDEAPGVLRRLDGCDVVLVDTPGRGPRQGDFAGEMAAILEVLRPTEVHLTLPAGIRPDLVEHAADSAVARPTHLLVTKLDEVPGDAGLAEIAGLLGLPVRWATDGQEVPADIRPAAARILASLGVGPVATRGAA